jgi:hypothetical protein
VPWSSCNAASMTRGNFSSYIYSLSFYIYDCLVCCRGVDMRLVTGLAFMLQRRKSYCNMDATIFHSISFFILIELIPSQILPLSRSPVDE